MIAAVARAVHHYRAEPVTQRFEHAEGPCWDARTAQLLWVDQYAGRVMVGDWDASAGRLGTARTYELGSPVGAVVPSRAFAGGWMVACAHGFGHLAVDGGLHLLAQPEDAAEQRMRMNDGKCDANGRFWAGSMAFAKTPGAGSLYRLDPDLTVSTVLRGVTISNGLAWTADGAGMYYIDTPTLRVDRFRVTADGRLADRVPVLQVPAGAPDGMCIDAEGALWVALWGASCVQRYAPDGELLAVVHVDAPQVSSCCLGGTDGRTLFVTTSQEGMDQAQRDSFPHSGRVFCVEVDVPAGPAAQFGVPA